MEQLLTPTVLIALITALFAGGGVGPYIVKRFFPTTADTVSVEKERQELLVTLIEKATERANEQEERYKNTVDRYNKSIDKLKAEIEELTATQQKMIVTITELRARVFAAESDTASYPYVSVLANIYMFAIEKEWDRIIPEIKKVAGANFQIRDTIAEVESAKNSSKDNQ